MLKKRKWKRGILLPITLLAVVALFCYHKATKPKEVERLNQDYIKWVDFNVSCDSLSASYLLDI